VILQIHYVGAISRFGRYNPIYRQSAGTGIGIDYSFSKNVNLSFGYIADNARNPRVGISKSSYGAIVQLTLKPVDNFKFALIYIRSFNNLNTGTGSELANDPFNDKSNSITANSYGVQTTLRLSRRLTIGGWVGLTEATAEDIKRKPNASIFNYAITFAFPDLGKKGNLAGIIIGQPPKVISNEFGKKYQDEATAWHLEMLYRFQVTDNIAITPGLLIITNPEHKQNSDTVYVGTIRTTFSF
jgi:Carbohydrate-selective porin, OprB family